MAACGCLWWKTRSGWPDCSGAPLKEEGHAVDGPQGLWLARENEYGAIVLDVMLPGMDGFQLCRRGVPVVSGLPVPPPLLPDARETVRACPLLALRLERVNR